MDQWKWSTVTDSETVKIFQFEQDPQVFRCIFRFNDTTRDKVL